MQIARLKVPAEIVFGSGAAATIGQQVRSLGGTRVLLISDRGLQKAGLVAQLERALATADISVVTYLDVEPEPSIASISPCLGHARAASCDVVVGLGGGSALDTAKAVAMLLTNPGTAEDYLGTGLVKVPGLPSILMPTTAGTGSEVTPNALFYVPARRSKEAIVSPYLLPSIALVDPALTRSVPPHITAATGMDALCHAIESYTSRNATPLSEPFAREAIALIAANVRRAVSDGEDLVAREAMALGSLYAAISLANASTNGVHALAYPLQGLNRITHGVANSLLLPYVMDFNWPGDVDKFARVAELMGQPVAGLTRQDAARATATACRQLTRDVGIPQRLAEVDIGMAQLDDLVAGALAVQRLLVNNPRPLGPDDVRGIFERAM